jgi:chlorophyllide a reductase subunit Z
MDKVEATPARVHEELSWDEDAKRLLDEIVEAEPVLVRISAAKRLRDAAEASARAEGLRHVSSEAVVRVSGSRREKELV